MLKTNDYDVDKAVQLIRDSDSYISEGLLVGKGKLLECDLCLSVDASFFSNSNPTMVGSRM